MKLEAEAEQSQWKYETMVEDESVRAKRSLENLELAMHKKLLVNDVYNVN